MTKAPYELVTLGLLFHQRKDYSMKKPSSGYVYVASVKNHPNLCKIGYTKQDPAVRVSRLKRDYPDYGFELYRSFHFERPARHELMAHNILHAVRFDREMFSVTPIEGCIAVERTVGKYFNTITDSESDFKESNNAPWEASVSNHSKSVYNYIRYNMGLTFDPEPSFDEFKNIANTYMELYNVRSHFDFSESLFVELCDEAGL